MKLLSLDNQTTFFPTEKYAQKFVLTLFLLCFYKIGNSIPLGNIDNQAFQKSIQVLSSKNNFLQSLSILSNGKVLITLFTLGVIPYINASLIIDFLSASFPFFEKLQSEEGSEGKKKLQFYKKLLSFLFASGQSLAMTNYLHPYLYINSFEAQFLLSLELLTGAMIIIWICNKIDTKGLGSGTSLIILLNIESSLVDKLGFSFFSSFHPSLILEFLGFYCFYVFIAASQSIEEHIPLISAKQLFYLKNQEINVQDVSANYLPLKLTQAGVFPIITALNIFSFFSYLVGKNFPNPFFQQLLYYFLIILLNYFYTFFFWDPQKISEELRKQSVSIPGFSPGKETQLLLSRLATWTSLKGGMILCSFLALFNFFSFFPGFFLLKQTNITSLIIGFGIILDIIRLVKSKFISRSFFLFLERFSFLK